MSIPNNDQDTGSTSTGTPGGDDFAATAAAVFENEGGTPAPEQSGDNRESAASASGASAAGAQPTPTLTPQQITEAVRAGVTPPAQERQYTQAELDQMFKVYNPTEDVVTKLLAGGQDALDALKMVREGLGTQFATLLKYQLDVFKRELNDQYSPALTYAQEARAEKERENFYKDNEDLRDHELQVDIAYKSLIGEGKQFNTVQDARKALADRARQLIPNSNGSGSGTTPTGGARQQITTTKPKPASLSGGGQVGGGGGVSATPNVFQEIFGKQ
jgi:hypothetical protein